MTEHAAALDWARTRAAEGALPAAVLGVARSDGVRVLEAFGTVAGRPARADDVFALLSVTKPIVGLLAARAVERGLLDLAEPLASALPGFGARRRDVVRLHHLLSHTSGVVEPGLDPARPLAEELLRADAEFAAGTASHYSSLAFAGVAALVEAAVGRPLDAQLGELAREAGAEGLTLDPVEAAPIAGIEQALDLDRFRALRHPGAGMSGRAEDLLALGMDLLRVARGGAGVVHPTTLAGMTVSRTDGLPRLEPYSAEAGQDWGLAWNLRRRAPGLLEREVVGHAGMSGVEWWLYPRLDLVFVLMTNRVGAAQHVAMDQLHNAVVAGLPVG